LDYKSTTRVRTKVPKSLAKRPRSSKPLTIRGLHLSGSSRCVSDGIGRQVPSPGTRSLTPDPGCRILL
jgi:hypothetical protein